MNTRRWTTEVKGLPVLAAAINGEHRRFEGALSGDVLHHAIKAGELLIEAKARCPHGNWQAWLEENFEGSVRTAQAYMREAGGQPKRMRASRL